MSVEVTQGEVGPKIVRGRVDALSLYEITDYELQQLEEGSIGATYLNLAIFCISVALSFLATLLAAPNLPLRVFIVFVVVAVVGLFVGAVLLVLWRRSRRTMSKVIKRIKDRVGKEAVLQDTSAHSAEACEENAG